MSVQKRSKGAWRVRWKEGDRWQSRTFTTKKDAKQLDAKILRLRRLGTLAELDAGTQTLDEFVTGTWAQTYAPMLSPKTRSLYTGLYDHHLSPQLGSVVLRQLTPELIARWQAERLAHPDSGPVAVAKSLTLLGNLLQRAVEGGHLTLNPVRAVRRAPLPRRAEVRPLAPTTIEAMRAASTPRDRMLISLLAYSGLRPGEALGLRWSDVRDRRTILVQRAISVGEIKAGKTGERTVRLLSPLASDLREWDLRSGRPAGKALIFPSRDGGPWTDPAYQSWRRRAFARAITAAGINHARPYDLRHSYASLLLYEGRSVIYVARQLGHDARLTLTTYGHVIEELEDAPRQDAETAILAARETCAAPQLPIATDRSPGA